MSRSTPRPPRPPHASSRLPRVLILIGTLWVAIGYLLVPWAIHALAPVVVASSLDARLDIRDVYFDPLALRLRMHGVTLTGPLSSQEFEARPLLEVALVDVDLSLLSSDALGPHLTVVVERPVLAVERAPSGDLNLLALLAPADPTADTSPAQAEKSLELFLALSDGRITVLDRSRPGDFTTAVTDIDVQIEALSIPAGDAGSARLSGAIEGARLDVQGALGLAPEAQLQVSLVDLPLALADRWLADTTPVRDLSGRVGASAEVSFGGSALAIRSGTTSLDELALALTGTLPIAAALGSARFEFEMDYAAEDLDLRAGTVRLEALRLDAPTPLATRIAVERLAITGIEGRPLDADLKISTIAVQAPALEATWTGVLPSLAAGGAAVDVAVDATPPATAEAPGPDPRLMIGAISVSELSVDITDATLPTPATLRIDEGRIDLGAIRLPAAAAPTPTPAQISLRALESGQLRFTGSLDPRPAAQGRLDLEALDLTPLAPWLDAWTQLGMRSGALSLAVELALAADGTLVLGGDPESTAGAELRIDDLRISDPDGVGLFLGPSLEVLGVHADTRQRSASIERIALAEPNLRFARFQDGTSNLSRVGPRTPAAPGPAAVDGEAAQGLAPWRWRIDRFEMRDGTLDFVDEALAIPFGTTIEELTADVTDIALDSGKPIDIRLDGRVPPNGTASIEAAVSLPDPQRQSTASLEFRRIAMPALTPYVGTFAGRRVAGGRLDLDLEYRVADARLSAENRVTAHALRLGPRVDSPSALDLPLDLALALLRDANDEIVLDVPVTGAVDDPEFSVSRVILRALGNVITGLVTAPFKLLTSLLPSGGPEIDRVEFELGLASIPEDQLERLEALETALNLRPSLILTLPPSHAGEADLGALRLAEMEARIAATGLEPEAAVRAYITETYGAETVAAIEAQYEAAGSSGEALLGEMRGRMLADITLPPETVTTLARSRGEAVRMQLVAAGLPEQRIHVTEEPVQVDASETRMVMHFDLSAAEDPASL